MKVSDWGKEYFNQMIFNMFIWSGSAHTVLSFFIRQLV